MWRKHSGRDGFRQIRYLLSPRECRREWKRPPWCHLRSIALRQGGSGSQSVGLTWRSTSLAHAWALKSRTHASIQIDPVLAETEQPTKTMLITQCQRLKATDSKRWSMRKIYGFWGTESRSGCPIPLGGVRSDKSNHIKFCQKIWELQVDEILWNLFLDFATSYSRVIDIN